jgi:hypothetical protein
MAKNRLTLLDLAVEILFAIAVHANRSDQIALSRVNGVFHSVATKVLYREIHLTSFKPMVSCCRTLAQVSEAALSVRTLNFDQ